MERKHRLRFVSDITKDIWKQIYSCKDGILDYDGWGFLWSCGFAAGLWRWTVEPEVSLHSDYLSLTRTTLRTPPRGFVVYGLLLRAMFVGKGFTVLLSFSFAVEWAKIAGYRSTESSLRKACLVRVRHCVAHRTLATALDFARCRHGKMFALSSVCWFSFLKIKYCCPIKLFWTGRKNQVWHLLQESAFWVTLLLPQTKTTMDKSIIFADSRSIVR